MSSTFPPDQAELLETFAELEDWQDRYEFLLDLGRELPPLPAAWQTADHKVHGCMSTVWLAMEPSPGLESRIDEPITIHADSDSLIVKGLIVALLSLYQGKTAKQALETDPAAFFSTLGLDQHLSPNRRNGLYSMVGRIRELCVQLAAGAG
jgi:cysteine desulfuration protein SufE